MVLSMEQLIRRRSAYRIRSRDAIANADAVAADEAQHDVATLNGHVTILEGIQRSLEDLDLQIADGLDDEAQIEEDIVASGQVFDTLVISVTKLRTLVSSLERSEQQEDDDRHSMRSNATTVWHRGGGSPGFHAKLPKLTLPTFQGDPLQWATFWDAYESSVHQQAMLPPVDKFNYLRSLLKGVALDSIAGIAITNANYDTAVNLIQQRFGQKQAIVNGHVEALVNLPKVTTDDTAKLRSMYDAAEIHIRGLETQDVTSADAGKIFTPILLTKLPDDIRLVITRNNDGPIGKLDRLRELLRCELQVRESSNPSSKKPVIGKPEKDPARHSTSTASALVNPSNTHRNSVYCQLYKASTHNVFDCTKFPTPDDRRRQSITNRLCLNCLRVDHIASKCESKGRCRTCHRRHHTVLCGAQVGTSSPQQRPVDQRTAVNMAIDQPNNTVGDPEATSQVLVSSSDAIWMQTARAAVHDPAGERHIVRILFDTGSHRSYITQTLARKLSLPTVKTEVIKVGTFGGQHARPQSYDVVEVQCSNPADNISHSITTIVVPQITCPVYRALVSSKIPAFKQLKLADPPSIHGQWMDIDILVGLDYYWQLVQDQVLRLPDHGLTAVSSVFGWLVSGSAATPHNTQSDATTLFTDSETFDCPSPLAEEKDQGELVLERFEKTIQFKDGRYEVGLPWKTQASDLPTNERLCRNRFNSLVRRLKREDVMQQYSDVIEQQAKLQFIEKVDDPSFSSGPVHYIPHHPVIKKDHATTKLRIVYDASAQQTPDDPSLNDSLYSGPNMVSSLIMLLLLFRSYAIVLLADIEKAFLQVALLIEDRDATRFLWLKDINKPPTDDNIEVWQFRRVPFGATSSPFLLAATLHYHLSLSTEPVAAKMTGQFYVDNLIVGVESNSEAIQVYHDAKRFMSTAGMNLREWMCNVPEVMEQIPPHDQAKGDEVKVLGLPWSIADDIIHTKSVPEMNVAVAPTKRHILQTIAKIFDPMGLVSPVVIAAKIFIQSLWKQNIGWDDQPSDVLIEQWRHLNHQLATVHSIAIQRRLLVAGSSQLHVFADASSKAYAAVAYVRTPKDGTYISQLAFSKSRVVPIEPSSTPRLELVAALLGCKLAAFLVECFPVIQSVKMWSDSQVVLHWIHNNPSKQGAFVTNRVRQIQAYQYPFRYCNTTENPADLPSRGRETADLGSSNLWWHGPAWLSSPEESWPEDIPKCNPSGIDVEHPENEAVAATANAFVPEPPFSMTLSNYSSLNKLLRVTALCSRFVSKLRRQPADTGAITAEELAQAKIRWITHVQLVHYQPQFACLASGKPDRLTRQFGLFLENNIIKCHGRFQHSDIHCNDVILLPKNDHFTYLVIAAQHNLLYHQGVRHTLAEIRRSYWIPQGRQQVRSILKRCVICKRWQGAAYSLPKPAALPMERLTQSPPFSFTGCDFAGPLYTFDTKEPKKTYICLFTCAVTRALHLELVPDMTTASFILALKRFISRRGSPTVIISDNAKTFKLAQATINRIWHGVVISPDTVNFVASTGIE